MSSCQSNNDNRAVFLYDTYNALKLHFTTSYDYFKYRGKTKLSITSKEQYDEFIHSKYYWPCITIAKKLNTKQEIVEFLVANLLTNNNKWIGDLTSEESEEIHFNWKKRQESLTYTFLNDLKILFSKQKAFNKYFDPRNGYSDVIDYLIQDRINIETVIILDWILGFMNQKKFVSLEKDFIFSTINNRLKKYSPIFFSYHSFDDENKKRFKKILKEKADDLINILPF